VAVIVAVISLNIQHWACWFCSYLLSSPRSRRVAAAGVGSNAPSMYLKGADERDVSVAVSRVRGRWPTGFLVTCEASRLARSGTSGGVSVTSSFRRAYRMDNRNAVK